MTLAAALLLPLAPFGALAQGQAPAPAQGPANSPPPAARPAEDPVVARVDGQDVRLSDVLATAQDVLPANLRELPPQMLLQVLPPDVRRQLTERTITERAITDAARTAGLDAPAMRAAVEGGAFRAAVDERIAAAHELGIHAVPTFVIADTYAIQGAQTADVFEKVLAKL